MVNDIAELGVKIGNQFFWLYKGHSLVYGGEPDEVARGVVLNTDTEPPTVMHWRPVFKLEFGECCHPINYKDFSKIGTVSPTDSEEWKPVPADILAKGGDQGEGSEDYQKENDDLTRLGRSVGK